MNLETDNEEETSALSSEKGRADDLGRTTQTAPHVRAERGRQKAALEP